MGRPSGRINLLFSDSWTDFDVEAALHPCKDFLGFVFASGDEMRNLMAFVLQV